MSLNLFDKNKMSKTLTVSIVCRYHCKTKFSDHFEYSPKFGEYFPDP